MAGGDTIHFLFALSLVVTALYLTISLIKPDDVQIGNVTISDIIQCMIKPSIYDGDATNRQNTVLWPGIGFLIYFVVYTGLMSCRYYKLFGDDAIQMDRNGYYVLKKFAWIFAAGQIILIIAFWYVHWRIDSCLYPPFQLHWLAYVLFTYNSVLGLCAICHMFMQIRARNHALTSK